MADQKLSPERLTLLYQFRQIAIASFSRPELQKGIVEASVLRLPRFSWAEFYILDPTAPWMLVSS